MNFNSATAAISTASGLLGAVIGAGAAYLAHRHERDERTSAIVATSSFPSTLALELEQARAQLTAAGGGERGAGGGMREAAIR